MEIGPATGVARVKRYIAMDDVGCAVNPMIVRDQVHGGIVQGGYCIDRRLIVVIDTAGALDLGATLVMLDACLRHRRCPLCVAQLVADI